MISIDEAQARIEEAVWRNATVRLPLGDAMGLALAEDITSDVNSPPHDKSLVDGYAIRAADVRAPGTRLTVLEEVPAGALPEHEVGPGTATRIMTGAPLPAGADAVVMFEDTLEMEDGQDPPAVEINQYPVQIGQHIMRRGESIEVGATVLRSGRVIRPIDVGLLCEVGRPEVQVVRPPRVAVLATGNELVPADQLPPAGKIRNSNGPMLAALARTIGAHVVNLGICVDEVRPLEEVIRRGLECDVLVLSGGVSAGVLDLVPPVLEKLGVKPVFHKVRLKPGKPLWFGTFTQDEHKTLVFGLPGNPVGSLVCFHLFVSRVLRQLSGRTEGTPPLVTANLACEHHQRGDRPTYYPALVERLEAGQLVATPLSWKGSADQRTVAAANCFILFPPGDHVYKMGESVEISVLTPE